MLRLAAACGGAVCHTCSLFYACARIIYGNSIGVLGHQTPVALAGVLGHQTPVNKGKSDPAQLLNQRPVNKRKNSGKRVKNRFPATAGTCF